MEEIKIQRATTLKPKPDFKALGFGKVFSDHMFLMNYTAGQGWHDPCEQAVIMVAHIARVRQRIISFFIVFSPFLS